MERDLGEGLIFVFSWLEFLIFVDHSLKIFNVHMSASFQVDFTIPGLTCPDASIAFDTDFG